MSPALPLGIENYVGVTIDNCNNCTNWELNIRLLTLAQGGAWIGG